MTNLFFTKCKFKKKDEDLKKKKTVLKAELMISLPTGLLFALTVCVGKAHLQTAAVRASFPCPVIDLQPDLKEPPFFKVRSYSFTIIALFGVSLAVVQEEEGFVVWTTVLTQEDKTARKFPS